MLLRLATRDAETSHPRPVRSSAGAAGTGFSAGSCKDPPEFRAGRKKSLRFNTKSSQSVIAVASALRSSPSRTAISPKISPALMIVKYGFFTFVGKRADFDASTQYGHQALPGRPFGKDFTAGRIAFHPGITYQKSRFRWRSAFQTRHDVRKICRFSWCVGEFMTVPFKVTFRMAGRLTRPRLERESSA